MKINMQLSLVVLLVIFVTGIGSISAANADQGACYLKATETDVFIVVYDLDRDGNRGSEVWQGRINAGESVLIKPPHSQIIYDYNAQPDVDQPLSGGTARWCDNKDTILVP